MRNLLKFIIQNYCIISYLSFILYYSLIQNNFSNIQFQSTKSIDNDLNIAKFTKTQSK